MGDAMRRAPKQVRYVSPFGSPAWMPREMAERLLVEDDRRWVWMMEIERETGHVVRSEREREIGSPRIEVHS